MMITAAIAREMANKARGEDLTLEKVMDKIISAAKQGEFMTNVFISKEHSGYVVKTLRKSDFQAKVIEERAYHNVIMITWDMKA